MIKGRFETRGQLFYNSWLHNGLSLQCSRNCPAILESTEELMIPI